MILTVKHRHILVRRPEVQLSSKGKAATAAAAELFSALELYEKLGRGRAQEGDLGALGRMLLLNNATSKTKGIQPFTAPLVSSPKHYGLMADG